jgi:hypothetical protein
VGAAETTKASSDPKSTDVVTRLGQLVGLAAGAVALVYAAGGGVLALRLYLAHLPSVKIASQLPREFLISIGLAQIVLPVVAVASLYAIWRVLRAPSAPPTWLVDSWQERWQRKRGRAAYVAAAVVPALVVAGLTSWFANDLRGGLKVLGWLVPLAFAVTALDVLLGLRARSRLVADSGGAPEAWSSRRSIGLMTLVVGLFGVPIAVIISGTTFPLLEAQVCTSGGVAQVGVLIGETSERTYLGEKHEPSGPLVVYSIPQSEIKLTIIGGGAGDRDCLKPAG